MLLEITQVTDAGLKELVKLQELKELQLPADGINAKVMAELKKALPNCKIQGP